MLPDRTSSLQVNLYDYLAVIKQHIWWGVVSGLIVLVTIGLYTFFWAKPVYHATVVYEIESTWSVLSSAGTLTSPKVESHLYLIKNEGVLFAAMQQLGLVDKTISPAEREQRVKNFAKPLTVSAIKDTALIEIKYDHSDPAQAAQIVNTIVKTYQANTLQEKEQKTSYRQVFIEKQINEIGQQLNILEARLQEMKTTGKTTEKTEILANKLAQLELDQVNQSSKLGVKHPTVLALENEMAELKKQMSRLTQNDLLYLTTLREKKLNENLFNLLNTRSKEIQIEIADKTTPLVVVSWALEPGKPFKPDKKKNLIFGSLLSLLIGFLIIFLRQALDLSLDTPEKVEEYLNRPVLVTIPRLKKLAQEVNLNEGKELMERLRQLETRILPGHEGGIILALVSPTKGSGKSTVAIYYALAAAVDGKKVLLVDTDLRNPNLHKRFNRTMEPGFADVLNKEVTLNQVIQNIPLSSGDEGTLNFIPSGRHTGSFLKLFSSPRLDKLLVSIKPSYDLILFDCPPPLAGSEVLLLCRKIEGYLLVHKPSRLDRYVLHRFKSQFMTELKDKCRGIVLNNYRYPEAGYDYDGYYNR